ncbi:MAG: CapA family protein [Candidatus Limnocylindrales bacterium]
MPRLRRSNPPLVLLALVALVSGCGTVTPSAPPSPSAPSPVAVASPSGTPIAATPSPTPQPTPTAAPTVAIVPVADFRTDATSVDRAGVAAILAGSNPKFGALELVSGDADGILTAIGLDRPSTAGRLLLAPTADALAADLDAKPSRLGLVRATDVGPSVRALGWEGRFLFGAARVRSLADWPLQASLGPSAAAETFDPTRTWTIAAAGDVMLDRGVYKVVRLDGKGVDFPFAGGTATITGHYCCSSFGWTMPRTKRLDTTPDVRNLISGADLALVNLEGPAPAKSRYHAHGMTFTFDQALLVGLKDAGMDWVSLANNHIGNAGRQGVVQTVQALDKLGIAHSGAGANRTAARTPALFSIDGVRVAVLAYDSIAGSYGAGSALPGSAQLSWGTAPADIRAARAAGAQVVIVYPHWGIEYKATPTAFERSWAHRMIDAGADLVIGNHSHWAAAMEVYKGKPIWYALGNFVFDQTWSEPTEEGLVLELTFSGSTLVQAWLHPTLILDGAQPNFLDTAGGKVVLNRVYGASKGLLSW